MVRATLSGNAKIPCGKDGIRDLTLTPTKSLFLILATYHNTYMASSHAGTNSVKSWESKHYRIVSNVRTWLNAMPIFRLVRTGTKENPIPVN
jgi:hypothetical protein